MNVYVLTRYYPDPGMDPDILGVYPTLTTAQFAAALEEGRLVYSEWLEVKPNFLHQSHGPEAAAWEGRSLYAHEWYRISEIGMFYPAQAAWDVLLEDAKPLLADAGLPVNREADHAD